MNKNTRVLIEAVRAAVRDIDDCIPGNGSIKERLTAALKPFDAAGKVRLAWTRTDGGLVCQVCGHTYSVHENGNEPARSTIRWVAMCDNRPLSDGEPRQRDAVALCVAHAIRSANKTSAA